MHILRLFTYISIAAGALLPAACDVRTPAAPEAAVRLVAPSDLSAGTSVAPTAPPSTLVSPEPTASPHPLRAVPEYEQRVPLVAPPAAPTHEAPAAIDGMPVLDQPAHDSMPHVPGAMTDPMPIVTPPIATRERNERETTIVN